MDHSKWLTSRESPIVEKMICPFALIRYPVSKCTQRPRITFIRAEELKRNQNNVLSQDMLFNSYSVALRYTSAHQQQAFCVSKCPLRGYVSQKITVFLCCILTWWLGSGENDLSRWEHFICGPSRVVTQISISQWATTTLEICIWFFPSVSEMKCNMFFALWKKWCCPLTCMSLLTWKCGRNGEEN